MTTDTQRPLTSLDAKRAFKLTDPLTVTEAARLMRIRYAVALRAIKAGKLPCTKLGARFFIERADAEHALREADAGRPLWAPYAMRLRSNGKRIPRKLARDVR